MTKGRMEAFSDGVLAIIITIMVLEMSAPHSAELSALRPLVPVLLSYVLSFVFLGIYWNNHHHLMQVVQHVSGAVLWANLHLLFWLTLIPFATAWMGENHFAAGPVAVYGVVLIGAAVAYFILVRVLLACHERQSALARAVGRDFKGIVSLLLYGVGLGFAWVNPLISCGFYVLVAMIWVVPDLRIERVLVAEHGAAHAGHDAHGGGHAPHEGEHEPRGGHDH